MVFPYRKRFPAALDTPYRDTADLLDRPRMDGLRVSRVSTGSVPCAVVARATSPTSIDDDRVLYKRPEYHRTDGDSPGVQCVCREGGPDARADGQGRARRHVVGRQCAIVYPPAVLGRAGESEEIVKKMAVFKETGMLTTPRTARNC